MNLDDLTYMQSLDSQNFLREIETLPDQIKQAWQWAQTLTLPADYAQAQNVIFSGMGGSSIGGALTHGFVANTCAVPVVISRDYGLPAWAGKNTLVVATSHSGNTEETLEAAEHARARGAKVLAITTGGQLAALGATHGFPVWRFNHTGQPRASVGFSFMLTLATLVKLGHIPDPSTEIAGALEAMRAQHPKLRAESLVIHNPAKRMAGQLMDRIGAIFAADYLIPVARRWKGQLTEVSKAWALFDEIPEMNHNSIVGTVYPEALVSKYMVLFLRSTHGPVRNRKRLDITREIYMTSGFNTDVIDAVGPSPLAHILTALHFGDYVAFYLAIAYGADPTPVPQIDYLKAQMKAG